MERALDVASAVIMHGVVPPPVATEQQNHRSHLSVCLIYVVRQTRATQGGGGVRARTPPVGKVRERGVLLPLVVRGERESGRRDGGLYLDGMIQGGGPSFTGFGVSGETGRSAWGGAGDSKADGGEAETWPSRRER